MPPALDSDDKDSARKLNIETVSSEGNDDSLVQIDGRKMSSKEPKPVVVGPGGDAENVANGTDPTVDQDDSKAEGDGHTRKRSGSPRKVVVTTHRHLSPSPGRDGRRQRTASCSQLQTSSKNTTIEPLIRTPNRTIYTAGRPPWYDSHGQQAEPCFIGICGGSASGKTTVAKAIIETLEVPWVTLLSMDSFYKILSPEQSALAHGSDYNFDSPDAFDFELLVETLHKLKEGKKVEVPIYNFVTHSREAKSKTMYGANVVIFEGIMSFHHEEVLKLLDVKVFVDTDSDVRLARRLERDIAQRGRDLRGVVTQYERFVKPAYDTYIAPSKAHADIVVPRGGENDVAIGLIVQHVQSQLHSRGFRVREKLLANEIHEEQPLPSQVYLLPSTRQIIGMHTYIRSKATPRDEFVFYSQRLMRLLMEYALTFLPHKEVIVDTATGQPYKGMTLDTHNICGVSIVRAGETMEQALTDVLKDVRIGKILIQTNLDNGEAELYYLRLPSNIHNYHVMVMDATVATGAAAMMAIRILLDHDVPEENILLLSLLMAKIGVQTIAYAFPKVRIITTAVDNKVNDQFYVVPGIGNFGDRYYGTEATPGF